MRAAVLVDVGTVAYGEFDDPRASNVEHTVLDVLAAGLNHLDVAKASGTFYTGPPTCPMVIGSDGVGSTPDGRRVYFDGCIAPYGSLAERTLVAAEDLLPVHPDLSAATAAALGNAGSAAAIALLRRGRLVRGQRVVIVGASGTVGRLAVQLAAITSAGLVVAAGRDRDRLGDLDRYGAVPAVLDGTRSDMRSALASLSPEGFDVIIDLVGGEPGNAALRCAAVSARYVQVGSKAGPDLDIPTALLRSRLLTITGTAGFRESRADRSGAYSLMQRLAAEGSLEVPYQEFGLAQIRQKWNQQIDGPPTKLIMAAASAD